MSADLTILELDEAAARLRATKHFVRLLISNGELPFVKIGKKFCVTVGDLNRWVETNRGRPGEADLPRTKGKERGKPILKAVRSAS